MLRSFRHRIAAAVGCLGCLGYLLFFGVLLSFSAAVAPAPRPTAQVAQAATSVPIPTVAPPAEPTAAPPPSATATAPPPTAAPKAPVRAEAKPTATPKPTGPSPEVAAYLEWLMPKVGTAGDSLKALAAQSEQASNNPRLILTNDWKLKTAVPLGFLKATGEQMQAYPGEITPGLKRLDDLVTALGKDLVYVVDEYSAGVDQVSAARITNATRRMDAANAKMREAAVEVGKLR